MLFPVTIASFIPNPAFQRWAQELIRGHLLYTVVYSLLIIFFCYFYTAIVFNTKYILSVASKYRYTLVKSENVSEEDYLVENMSKVWLITVIFLIATALIPDLTIVIFKIPYLVASLIGGIGIAFVVGVFSDIIRQLEFFKDKEESGIKDWQICYIAFDEIEAKIKSEYLKTKGISALVEPLRFTWGMPIRTMVDQYRIYVPADKKEEARNLIA